MCSEVETSALHCITLYAALYYREVQCSVVQCSEGEWRLKARCGRLRAVISHHHLWEKAAKPLTSSVKRLQSNWSSGDSRQENEEKIETEY